MTPTEMEMEAATRFPWGKWLVQTLGQRDDKEAPNTHQVSNVENTAG